MHPESAGAMGMFGPEHHHSINQMPNPQMRQYNARIYEDGYDDMDSQVEYGRITHL